jgi:hypothetical protein
MAFSMDCTVTGVEQAGHLQHVDRGQLGGGIRRRAVESAGTVGAGRWWAVPTPSAEKGQPNQARERGNKKGDR